MEPEALVDHGLQEVQPADLLVAQGPGAADLVCLVQNSGLDLGVLEDVPQAPSHGLRCRVTPGDEEVQHQVLQQGIALGLTRLHEEPDEAVPGGRVRATRLQALHDLLAVASEHGEVLSSTPFAAQAEQPEQRPAWHHKAQHDDLLCPVKGLQEGRVGCLQRANVRPEADLADRVECESVQQIEDVHCTAAFLGLQHLHHPG
mmetsp:Transcript_23763/g.59973  ORF Transcript_23763/g.59973 Transcript_23763/m.59973 type:complete len:202 (+) Transcript_23763:692-1297(+)